MLALSSSVTELKQISDRYADLLQKLGVETVADLLTHFPRYHKDTSALSSISDVTEEGDFTFAATVSNLTSVRIRGGRTMQKALLTDSEGYTISATWWNQPYLVRALNSTAQFIFAGKAKEYRGGLNFFPSNFEQVVPGREQVHLGRISPQYRLTKGVSPKWLRNRIKALLDDDDLMQKLKDDFEPVAQVLRREVGKSLDLDQAIKMIHFPASIQDFEAAFDFLSLTELASLQLKMLDKLAARQAFHAPKLQIDKDRINKFIKSLEFELTQDQKVTVANVLVDLSHSKPMNRLVQGDVGSGKTIIAVIAALAMHSAEYQTIILSPTTVLANQHFATFSQLLKDQGVSVALVTGDTNTNEAADIVIGTSAVLARQKNVITKPGLVIIDEQHRFGVEQREELVKPFEFPAGSYPHFLNMTATPIPRTMAMTLFGDIEVSSIHTKPAGRRAIKTFVVPEAKRNDSYDWIKNQITSTQQQAFWICPLVEESETLEAASAKKVHADLQKIYPKLKIGLLHGKMSGKAKQAVMDEFTAGELQILVSTSVIEVGIDVKNATMMIIEGAERFGLAQLHQIRGRVGRGDEQSWCFLFASPDAQPEAMERLDFFAAHSDGLEIATYDLERRGPGEVYGTRQSGVPDMKLASLMNLQQLKVSRQIAGKLSQAGIKQIPLF